MKDYSFEEIEKSKNIKYEYEKQANGSLPQWYDKIRKRKVSEFSVSDLCIALRQYMFVEYVMPYVLKILEDNILAGGMYDGELFTSLARVSLKNWEQMSREKEKILGLIQSNKKLLLEEIPDKTEELLSLLENN